MINVSNEFKRQLANDNRNYLEYADITLKDGTVLNLTNKDLWNGGLSVEDAVSSDNSFDIGAVIINKCTLTINNIYDEFSDYVFEDAEVVASVGLSLDVIDETVGRNLVTGSKEISITRINTTNNWLAEKVPFFKNTDYGFEQIQQGGQFTLSFDYKITGITTASSFSLGLKYSNTSYTNIGKTITLSTGDNIGHFEHTFTPTEAQMQYGTGWLLIGFGAGQNQGAVITLRNIKLETGNIATGYTIAPEDVRIEKIRKGTYAVDEPNYNGSIITLSCLDNMRKFDRSYSESKLTYPATLNAIVRDACSVCGVTLQTVNFPHDSFVIQTRPTDEATTFREVISWAAQIAGCFSRCDAYGRLQLKWYDQKALENPKVVDWSVGENLLPNTKDMAGYSKTSNVTLSEDAEGITVASFAAVSTLAYNNIATRDPIPFSAVRGKKVTFSVWVRSDDAAAINADTSHGLLIAFGLCTGTLTARTLYKSKGFYSDTLSGSWKKIAWTATLSDSFFTSGTGTIDDDTRFIVYVYDYSTYRMQVKKLKLEIGENSTGYSIAFNEENAHWIKSNYSAPVVSLDDVVITGVRVVEKNESEDTEEQLTTYQAGTDGYVISIENNELIKGGAGQTVAGWLGEQLIGMKFRKATVNHASDPTVEAGDIAVANDRKGNNYNIVVSSTKFSTGGSQNTVSAAENPARNSSARYSAQTKNYVEWRRAIEKEKSEREKALDALGERIDNSQGVFTTVETQSNGSKIYYLHNKPNLSESDMVWKMTAEAWAVSTDGGKTWNAGMTVDGDTIVRILTAEGVSASWINTGVLRVADKDNNEIMYVDVDNGVVRINAQSLTIAGSPVASEQYVADKLQRLNALNIILSNDYYSVPVNAEGNVPDGAFAGADTTVTILWGTQDITGKVKIVISESAGLSGVWNDTTKRYTVTSLTSDNGWADFSTTYNGVNIVKRYTIVKRYPGADGEPGKSYQLGCSADTVRKVTAGEILPHYIDFESYYFDSEAKRKEYTGRFVVEESADGINWTRKYVSGNDESFLRYHFYQPIGTASRKYLADAAGRFLASKRIADNVIAIRCTLYAAGGTEDIVDRQTISIITDATALSSEEYFELLTDHGRIQGIFMRGDQLFINGEYIQTRGLKSVDKTGNTTFYVNDDGELQIDATSMKISGKAGATQEYADNSSKSAVDAQTQLDIFNKLTNNGAAQGITLLSDGTLWINGEFIQAKGLRVVNQSGTQTFYIDNNGNVSLNVTSLLISGASAATQSYANTQASNALSSAKTYADTSAKKAVDAQTQKEIFDKLTNNSNEQGIYLYNGKIYLNFAFAQGQTLNLGGADNGNGLLQIFDSNGNRIGYIDNTGVYFEQGIFRGTISAGYIDGGTVYGASILAAFFSTASNSTDESGIRISANAQEFYPGAKLIMYNRRLGGEWYTSFFELGTISELRGSGDILEEHEYPYINTNGLGLNIDKLVVTGAKSRVIETQHYGNRLQNSYEMPFALFGDIGTGITDENGICYVEIDDIFSETVRTDIEYFVFLQKEGQGDLWVDLKESTFFVIKGTPNLRFSWEIKAVQRDFETLRLDEYGVYYDITEDESTEHMYEEEVKIYEKEMEELYYE